ncbi:putative efflux protein, MATE family [Ruminococcaceae bacterium YRB3002]|nr:putative efflux protein, MATE family [Ruminococcaceae bacterium YRB3002]
MHIIVYAIPMILGNYLQLTYNMADAIIISKFLGEDSLAAVSTAGPIMTLMVLGASGIGMGASIIISRLYGAEEYGRLKREFSTAVIAGTAFSLVVFILGFLFAREILILIKTPEAVLEESLTYLRIMFVGFLFTFQYNIMSHSLRGIGNSFMPVVFLGVSCSLNIALDLLFVAKLNMGSAGAGIATVISQAVAAAGCVIYIYAKVGLLRLRKGDFVVDRSLLGETSRLGLITALQQAAQPVGKIFIQSTINSCGVTVIGAFNAVCRIDDFACIPAQSIGSGIMTCVAQNRGHNDPVRVRKTMKWGLIAALCYFPVIFTVVQLFKTPLVTFLTPDGADLMINMGVSYLSVKSWIFLLACIVNANQGFLRGSSKMHIALISTVLQITIRAVLVWLWVPQYGIVCEAWACAIGWIAQTVFGYGYYFLKLRKKM